MPHWRSMFSKQSEYLRSADLWDDKRDGFREVVVQIERVAQGTIVGEKGRADKMPFAYFVDKQKPLGLNATNCKTLVALSGSQNASKWVGLWITLYVTKTESKTGEVVDAIRIRPKLAEPPKSEPRKEPSDA